MGAAQVERSELVELQFRDGLNYLLHKRMQANDRLSYETMKTGMRVKATNPSYGLKSFSRAGKSQHVMVACLRASFSQSAVSAAGWFSGLPLAEILPVICIRQKLEPADGLTLVVLNDWP